MNKKQFIKQLEKKLKGLKHRDIQVGMQYYTEIIDDKIEEGFSEELAVASVGDINVIAATIKGDYLMRVGQSPTPNYAPPFSAPTNQNYASSQNFNSTQGANLKGNNTSTQTYGVQGHNNSNQTYQQPQQIYVNTPPPQVIYTPPQMVYALNQPTGVQPAQLNAKKKNGCLGFLIGSIKVFCSFVTWILLIAFGITGVAVIASGPALIAAVAISAYTTVFSGMQIAFLCCIGAFAGLLLIAIGVIILLSIKSISRATVLRKKYKARRANK